MENNIKKNVLEIFLNYLTHTPVYILFLHLIWIILVSGVVSTSYILAFHFSSLVNFYREAHDVKNFQSNLRLSAEQDIQINKMLQNILENTHANRAYVARFHNGLAAVSSIPFFFHSLTHEVIVPGAQRILQFEQHVPTSINLNFNENFFQNKCTILRNTDDDRESNRFWHFQVRGARSVVRCPIFLKNGDLLGFIGVDYVGNIDLRILREIENKLKFNAENIATIFSSKK